MWCNFQFRYGAEVAHERQTRNVVYKTASELFASQFTKHRTNIEMWRSLEGSFKLYLDSKRNCIPSCQGDLRLKQARFFSLIRIQGGAPQPSFLVEAQVRGSII